MGRIYRINNWNVGPLFAINGGRLKERGALGYVGIFSSLNLVSILRQHSRCYTSTYSNFTPFSEQWCKQKKAEIYKKGFPVVFEDMSKMKDFGYFATTKSGIKHLSLSLLKDTPGIYMITCKVTKKIYIGMTINLKNRLYNYLDIKRLEGNRSIRIHKVLLKHGFEKFSISILEMYPNKEGTRVKSSFLREREDFYIKVFKPQYNIKRSMFNRDMELESGIKIKLNLETPTKIKNLLDKCIEPALLDWNLTYFKYNSSKHYYLFRAITPRGMITANSSGWFEGTIHKAIGFEDKKIEKPYIEDIIEAQKNDVDKEALARFYLNEKPGFVIKNLKMKIIALRSILKKDNNLKKPTPIDLKTQEVSKIKRVYTETISPFLGISHDIKTLDIFGENWANFVTISTLPATLNNEFWKIMPRWMKLDNHAENIIQHSKTVTFRATIQLFYLTGVMYNRDRDKLAIYADHIIYESNSLACNEAGMRLSKFTDVQYKGLKVKNKKKKEGSYEIGIY